MNENRSYLERRSGNTSSKKWASRTLTKPSRGKCHVLHLGGSNPLLDERQGLAGFGAALQEKRWRK